MPSALEKLREAIKDAAAGPAREALQRRLTEVVREIEANALKKAGHATPSKTNPLVWAVVAYLVLTD